MIAHPRSLFRDNGEFNGRVRSEEHRGFIFCFLSLTKSLNNLGVIMAVEDETVENCLM